jgi:hypothetical protein
VSYWRSGWKFWPDRPQGPVGDAYRQVSWIRPYRPGFPRVAIVLGLALLLAYFAAGALLVLLAPGLPLLERAGVTLVVVPVVVGLSVLVGRLFASGIYVNDYGLRLVTVRRTLTTRWNEVVDVSDVRARAGILGWPVPRVPADSVVVTLRDLGPIQTPVSSVGADFVGRREAYDMAAGAVERWWRDAGLEHS